MEYNYRPLGDRVVVEILKRNDEKTKGGLYKPSGSETTMLGKVVSVGNGLFTQTGNRIPMTIKAGDTVLVSKNSLGSQKKIKFDSIEYVLVREMEISMVSN